MAVETLADAAIVVHTDFTKAKAQASAGAKSVGQSAGKQAGDTFVDRFGKSFSEGKQRLLGSFQSIAGVVTAGLGIAGIVKFGLQSAASLEQARVGFTTLLGSAQKAGSYLQDLQKFAAATPFELKGLIDSSRTLLGVGVDAKQVIPLLRAFGDAAGAVGVGQEAFQRIILATSQAISAGKFQQGDLNQIMTNGIPIYTILSQAMGKPVTEIRKLATEGKLLSKDVLPLLQKQMEKDYGGAMAKQSMTLAGVWSTLKDTIAIGLSNALTPLIPILGVLIPKAAMVAQGVLGGVGRTIAALAKSMQSGEVTTGGFIGAVQNVGVTIGNVFRVLAGQSIAAKAQNEFTQVAAAIRGMIPTVIHFGQAFLTTLVPALRIAVTALASVIVWLARNRDIAAALAVTIGALVAVTKAHAVVLEVQAAGSLIKYISKISIVQAATKVWAAVQWVLNAALSANPIGIVVVALAALGAALYLAWTRSATFRSVVIGAWQAIRGVVGAIGGWITGTLVPAVVGAWKAIASAVTWLYTTIFAPYFHLIGRVVQAEMAVAQLALKLVQVYIVGPFLQGLAALRATVGAVMAAVGGFFQRGWNTIRGLLTQFATFLTRNMNAALTAFGNATGIHWSAVQAKITAVWNAIKGVFNALVNFVTRTIPNAFGTAVAAVGRAWQKIQDTVKAPITFTVNHVINPLINGFDRVAKAFGTSTIAPIGGFAEGGQIPGSPSGTDNRWSWLRGPGGQVLGTAGLATGEFVVNARDTAKALPLLRWINDGMAGGPASVSRYLGRPMFDMPGDGSEGWAFAKGGLVGFLKDVWGAISNPVNLIKKPVEAALSAIPGAGLVKDMVVGMGRKLLTGLLGFMTGGTSGAATGSVGAAQSFLRAQNGKPYIWASAGPQGYDCSGIVSAVYNILKGRPVHNHTFSTESAAPFFPKPGFGGPLVAGWSHPGQAPASAGVGHMMGMVGGLTFESTGSRGVHLGATTRRVSDFANIGHFDRGGIVKLAQIARADFGSAVLERGTNLIYNGTGKREPLVSPSAGGTRMHPDDIAALAEAIGGVVGGALLSTVSLTRVATRQMGSRR